MIFDCQTSNGINYNWDITSPKGANFYLYPDKTHTMKDIIKAKKLIRRDHDVYNFYVIRSK